MQLRYTITEQDYLDFNVYHIEHSDSLRKLARRYRLLFPVLFSLIGVGFAILMIYKFGTRAFPFTYLAGCLAFAALWYALYPRLHRNAVKKRIKSYVAEGNGKEFIGDFTLLLLDDRLRMEGQDGVAEKGYDKVRKLVTDKDRLYIYTGSMTAVILPLHVFGSDGAYREFRNHLEEKMRVAGGTLGQS